MKQWKYSFVLGAALLLFSACSPKKEEVKEETSNKTSTTQVKPSATSTSTIEKESTTESKLETTLSSEKEETTASTVTKEEPTVEQGKALLVGKWKTKDPNAHVIIEYVFGEDNSYQNFSDARGTTLTGTYEVTAFDGNQITFVGKLPDQEPYEYHYEFKNNQTELYMKDESSGIEQEFVKVSEG